MKGQTHFPFLFSDRWNVLKSNDIVTWLHGSDTLADGLNNTGSLVAEDDRESTFGILSGECVGI
jgi:hypothetical protein